MSNSPAAAATEAGSDLTNVSLFTAPLSSTSPFALATAKKPAQKTLRRRHSYAKQARFQRMNVCVRVCASVLLEWLIPLLEGPLHLSVNSQET